MKKVKRASFKEDVDDLDDDIDSDIDDNDDLGLDDEEDIADSNNDLLDDDKDDGLFNEDLDDDYYGGGGGISPLQKHNDLLKELTNFAPYLKDTVNGWLGISWSETEQKYIQNPDLKPIMNIKCAAWCVSFLKTYTRQNNIITDISKDHYKFMVQDIIDTVWMNIGTRYEEFDIKDEGDMLRVCVELEHAASLVLMGAGDGKYNKFLGVVTTRHETVQSQGQLGPGGYSNVMPGQKKETIIDRFKNVIFGGR